MCNPAVKALAVDLWLCVSVFRTDLPLISRMRHECGRVKGVVCGAEYAGPAIIASRRVRPRVLVPRIEKKPDDEKMRVWKHCSAR